MTRSGRIVHRRLAAAAWRAALCAVLLAPSAARAATPRPLENCLKYLVVSPSFATDGTAFCATSMQGKFYLYVTRDHAKTWTTTEPTGVVLQPGLPAMVSDLLISPDFAADRTLVAMVTGSMFFSTDAGATFLQAPGTSHTRLAMADSLNDISGPPPHEALLSARRLCAWFTASTV